MPIPACSADKAYQTCISRIRDQDLKQRLEGAREEIRRVDVSYRKAGTDRDFSELRPETCGVARVSAEEMMRIYDWRMAAPGSPGREIYDKIKIGSPGDLCPLCGQRVVATLDHYLPKSRYAALAVNPANLIPACSDCNKAKSNAVDDTLHPYYDNIENDLWLRAELKEARPASVSFFADLPAAWTSTLSERVTRHFKTFGLSKLYAVHAAQELSGLHGQLAKLASNGGAAMVRTQLAERAESWQAVRLNSWQFALYDCLASSGWFCSGGFRL